MKTYMFMESEARQSMTLVLGVRSQFRTVLFPKRYNK